MRDEQFAALWIGHLRNRLPQPSDITEADGMTTCHWLEGLIPSHTVAWLAGYEAALDAVAAAECAGR
jgi:hypothetical protein